MRIQALAAGLLLAAGCTGAGSDTPHAAESAPALSHLAFGTRHELYVEAAQLVADQPASFAVHLTLLGETPSPIDTGLVTVSLIVAGEGVRNRAEAPASPGLYRVGLVPPTAGTGTLVVEYALGDHLERFEVQGLRIHPDSATAAAAAPLPPEGDIVFTLEDVWRTGVTSEPVRRGPHHAVVRAIGELEAVPSADHLVPALVSGTVGFKPNDLTPGEAVRSGEGLVLIRGGGFARGSMDAEIREWRARYEQARTEVERARPLHAAGLISDREWVDLRTNLETAEARYESMSRLYRDGGAWMTSPVSGYVSEVFVRSGDHVEEGDPLVRVVRTDRLRLVARIPLHEMPRLRGVRSADVRPAGADAHTDTRNLDGRVVAMARDTDPGSPFVDLTVDLRNPGDWVPGAGADVLIHAEAVPDALLVPVTALQEENGTYFVYVRTAGERYARREVVVLDRDGKHARIGSGLSEGEVVVTRGATRIRVSAASGALPAHGHEH